MMMLDSFSLDDNLQFGLIMTMVTLRMMMMTLVMTMTTYSLPDCDVEHLAIEEGLLPLLDRHLRLR